MRSIFTVVRVVNQGAETLGLDKSAIIAMYAVRQLGTARPSGVATACGLDQSTISRHLKALEDKGLISRSPDPDDGRAQQVALTDSGQKLLADNDELRLERLTAALDGWSADERTVLAQSIGRLADSLIIANARQKVGLPI